MSRGSASTARYALLGAQSPEGTLLREALACHRVASQRVDLFGTVSGEALLSEYDGEARLIQEPVASEILAHDIVFLCESDSAAREILAAARRRGSVVIDLAGCTAGDDVPVVHPGINPDAARSAGGVLAVPHGISAMLAELLAVIDRGLGVRRCMAVVMRPAADFGTEGIEELREQTVRLFNFNAVPKQRFGRQLSFNLIPQRLMESADAELDVRIEHEVGRILGWDEPRLALRLVNVPVFHGHAACVRVETVEAGGRSAVCEALEGVEGLRGPSAAAASTPLETADERLTVAAEISDDGLGGVWLWIVAGEVGRTPAELAVRLADAHAA